MNCPGMLKALCSCLSINNIYFRGGERERGVREEMEISYSATSNL